MNKSEAHNTTPPPNTVAYVESRRVEPGDRIRLTRDVGTRAAGDEGTVTGLPPHWSCYVRFDGEPSQWQTDGCALKDSEYEVIPDAA